MEERRRADAFEKGDSHLQIVSWGLWGIAMLWFFGPGAVAPRTFEAHLVGEPAISLLCCGVLCGSMSKASPRGTWSSWRRLWHLAWSGVFGSIAVALALTLVGRASTVAMFSWCIVAACGGLCAMGLATCPTATTKPARSSSFWLGRLILVPNGVLGLLIGAYMLLGSAGLLAQPFGLAAALLSALPLGMCSLACILASTDKELVAVLPPVVLVHVVGFVGHSAYQGLLVAVPSAAAVLLHCALFLPFPDPESNPLHVWIRSYFRSFSKLMTEPVTGFGDENE